MSELYPPRDGVFKFVAL